MKNIYFVQAHHDDLPIILQFLREAALWLRKRGIDYWQYRIAPRFKEYIAQ
jgi:hypothetical protein